MRIDKFKSIFQWVATILSAVVLIPVFGEFFIKLAEEYGVYDQPSAKIRAIGLFISSLTDSKFFPWIGGVIIGFTAATWFEKALKYFGERYFGGSATESSSPNVKRSAGRPDTRLRIRLDPNQTNHYFQDKINNIFSWKQTVMQVSVDGVDGHRTVIHCDHIIVTFEEDTEYERPIVDSFGAPIPGYSFFSLGKKGAISQFTDRIQAPTIEIFFPPLGYYNSIEKLKSDS